MSNKPKETRGGKRKGAGRKPTPEPNRISCTYKLPPEVVEYLRQTDNATETILTAVARSKAYREWKASQ